jgi:hypothetical protein
MFGTLQIKLAPNLLSLSLPLLLSLWLLSQLQFNRLSAIQKHTSLLMELANFALTILLLQEEQGIQLGKLVSVLEV